MSLRSLASQLADTLADGGWRAKARPSQLPPPAFTGDGPANGWTYLGGRGTGKTRAGAEWIRELVETGAARRIALVGPTAGDCRDIMVEGAAGILAVSSQRCRPQYESSKRRLTWPNGAVASMFSSEESDRLRGPEHDALWADELASWNNAQATWDMAMFGLRVGAHPRWLVTTTPRPIRLLKGLLAREGQDVVVTRGSTFENAANLAPSFLADVKTRYEGTRLGRQELNAELLEDVAGALWSRAMIDDAALKTELPNMARVVVAVDPSGTAGASDEGDSIGIVVAGKGVDGKAYVLADRSCKLSPDGWGRRAVAAYRDFKADRIIAEKNFGGAMVAHVIRTVDASVSYREVTASRGKIQRSEPVAALYEQGRVKHAHSFPELEDEMCAMTSDGYAGDGSPDRCDALVWALSELMVSGVEPVQPYFGLQTTTGTGWNGAFHTGGNNGTPGRPDSCVYAPTSEGLKQMLWDIGGRR
jgi:predicted phage terminase large subunit-like protein